MPQGKLLANSHKLNKPYSQISLLGDWFVQIIFFRSDYWLSITRAAVVNQDGSLWIIKSDFVVNIVKSNHQKNESCIVKQKCFLFSIIWWEFPHFKNVSQELILAKSRNKKMKLIQLEQKDTLFSEIKLVNFTLNFGTWFQNWHNDKFHNKHWEVTL